jgi:hypothetical protein
MDKGTTHVALDDSKRKVVVAILRPGATEPEQREMAKDPHLIRRMFQRLTRGGPVQACYEAGVRGTTSIASSPPAASPARSWPRP